MLFSKFYSDLVDDGFYSATKLFHFCSHDGSLILMEMLIDIWNPCCGLRTSLVDRRFTPFLSFGTINVSRWRQPTCVTYCFYSLNRYGYRERGRLFVFWHADGSERHVVEETRNDPPLKETHLGLQYSIPLSNLSCFRETVIASIAFFGCLTRYWLPFLVSIANGGSLHFFFETFYIYWPPVKLTIYLSFER